MHRRSRFQAALMVLALLLPLPALCAESVPAPIPVANFMRFAAYSEVKLSPSGRLLAMLVPAPERKALAVMDLAERKVTLAAAYKDMDVADFNWVNDQRLVFSVNDQKTTASEQQGGGLFAVDRDGSAFKELAATLGRYKAFTRSFGEGDEIRVVSNEDNADHPQLYRLNTRTARMRLISGGIVGEVSRWVLDRNEVVRAALRVEEYDGKRIEQLIYRASANAPWEVLNSANENDEGRMLPVSLSADESELYVFSSKGRPTMALFAYDLKERKLGDLLAAHPRVDLDRVIYDPKTQEIQGVLYQSERSATLWFDDKMAALQKGLDAAMAGHRNVIVSRAGSRAVVYSYSDRDPGRFYLWEGEKRKLEELFSTKDWIDPAQMAEMRPIEYAARDGMKIPAYLTLPAGRAEKNLPLIVMPHGGPFGIRDNWGWNGEVQFLANRGYAVLQPQYRGSGGYGRKHYAAGFKQWGRAMQDDLSDGIKYLVEQGIVNPKRVAIVGASYGGYAALAGGAYTPELYKGVVSRFGVSDLALMFKSNYWQESGSDKWYDFDARDMIGDPKKDAEQFRATSPVNAAANFRVPVLITQGQEDTRVIPKHATDMAAALRAAGKPVELMMVQGEGHGFYKESNRVDEWTKIEAYLKQQLGE
ncbi:alpha/beta hydrolase family protein [Niveibacterium terrae]|uniref:alpha/beta hydrolase family protein n=1 Tax=Niveibacterium terrae TaxID=3373598 RepID=UPI003A904C09